jgi:DNA-binding NarL/FixJ family response regulator
MRVLIVAGNQFAAETIRRELRHAGAFDVLGFVDARQRCALAISQAAPDVVLVDDAAGTPEEVLASVREARTGAPEAKLVLLVTRTDPAWLRDASGAGIDAAIAKTVSRGGLTLILREVVAGNVFHAFSRPATNSAPRSHDAFGLTARELGILRLVAAGGSNRSIAAGLWVTEQTVKFHLSNIYRKLGVTNRTEASHFAHVNGLLEHRPLRHLDDERAA